MADDELGQRALRSFVTPFYLTLMGSGAVEADERLLARVRRAGRRVSDRRVRLMLAGTWRPLVMGSWYAIARDDLALGDAVHDALKTCLGHLTSPPLITAAVMYPSRRTLPLLIDYADCDRQEGWGAAGLAEAAFRRLSGDRAAPEDAAALQNDELLAALLQRGRQLRA
ncbi:hypothetical protein KMZ32_18765 [Phycicoccus sp. MAQZ13P-2]|uniref:hypothetical protein n=1 Tax=Phycicoccus mangrovi TaxID=2840470 RepID=UPI001C0009B3|nr:hypothetical protein [Phycicoccus mangrovi]MBT9276121.1 hypothetical protein [Phycicoccus mangrovi]